MISKWTGKLFSAAEHDNEDDDEIWSAAVVTSVAKELAQRQMKRRLDRKPKNKVVDKVHLFPSAANHDVNDEIGYNPSKWRFDEHAFHGRYGSTRMGEVEAVTGKLITDGLELFRGDPRKYLAILYQSDMLEWPAEQQSYTLIHREGTSGFKPMGTDQPSGQLTIIVAIYQALPKLETANALPPFTHTLVRDKYTDSMSYHGAGITKALSPGRGEGLGDVPDLKLVSKIDPNDVRQGRVGDCWLMSGLSSLAEFEGAIMRLFRKTPDLDNMPGDGSNSYTITLYDLKTWKEVDIVVDERLPCLPGQDVTLLGCNLTRDNELWPCYVEKAVAAHCGGWDKIDGGLFTHALMLLTGCREQYVISRNGRSGCFQCFGSFNPNELRWEDMANSPHEGFQGLWPMEWPDEGGGGAIGLELSEDDLFERLCAWEDANYIIGASATGSSDGIESGHAYSLLTVVNDAADTDIDLIKMRNPYGKGELTSGIWDDDGLGWQHYPQIKELLNPVNADDGVFWVSKDEFFQFFDSVYLCAQDMSEWMAPDEDAKLAKLAAARGRRSGLSPGR